MKLQKLLLGTALTSGLLAAAGTLPAAADPINLGGYTGPVLLNFNNYESFMTSTGAITSAPAVGDQNFGIFTVFSITTGTALHKQLFAAGQNGLALVGVFDGITVSSVTGSGATETTKNTGGIFQLYSVSTAAFLAAGGDQGLAGYTTAGCAVGSLCYNGITNTVGGSLALTLTLTPGVDPSDPTVTLTATVDALDTPPTGGANFDGIVSGTTEFAPSAFGKDSFCPNAGPDSLTCAGADGSTFALASQDPIQATAIPEPASLALFGAGLLGLAGMFGWRRRKSNMI